jgi:hypothetical protein
MLLCLGVGISCVRTLEKVRADIGRPTLFLIKGWKIFEDPFRASSLVVGSI